ncbi:MAG: insulinase family protein, partial [Lachnospiraceae bacterium]|nr:insulinase family protein [Lachnospiraceae bacterium]
FDCRKIPGRLFPYLGLLKGLQGMLDTAHYGYGELFDKINLETGGIISAAQVYTDYSAEGAPVPIFEIRAKVLRGKLDAAMDLICEMLFSTKFEDEKRMRELLKEGLSRMQSQMMGAGHSLAASRAMSYGSEAAAYQEQLSGFSLYRLFEELDQGFSERKDALAASLGNLCRMLFTKENLLVDYTGEKEDLQELQKALEKLQERLYPAAKEEETFHPGLEKANEGLMFASQVQFVARAGNFKKHGLPYTGAFRVLKVLMGYDYLWTQIRVLGGAYGCMCGFKRNGESYFVSYRDPHLSETIEVYEKAPVFLRDFQADERTMDKYVIGAIGDLDAPMTPQARASYSLIAYLSKLTYEDVQKERDEVLGATEESIRKLADHVEAFLSDGQLCVVGAETKIEEEKELFGRIDYLVKV